MNRFEDKVAIVIGGGSGMGKATVERLISEGCRVAVADVSGAQNAVAGKYGDKAFGVQCDVASASDVEQAIARVVDRFGNLQILINCSGICERPMPIVDFDEAEFDRTVAVDFKGVMLAMKYGIPAIIQSGGGAVVNVASTAALSAYPGTCAYTGSKGAVIAITRSAALEYAADNVRVNCIAPGMTLTPILLRHVQDLPDPDAALRVMARNNMLCRGADPSEIASAIVFMASADASYITGVTLAVDGGQTAFSSALSEDAPEILAGAVLERKAAKQ